MTVGGGSRASVPEYTTVCDFGLAASGSSARSSVQAATIGTGNSIRTIPSSPRLTPRFGRAGTPALPFAGPVQPPRCTSDCRPSSLPDNVPARSVPRAGHPTDNSSPMTASISARCLGQRQPAAHLKPRTNRFPDSPPSASKASRHPVGRTGLPVSSIWQRPSEHSIAPACDHTLLRRQR